MPPRAIRSRGMQSLVTPKETRYCGTVIAGSLSGRPVPATIAAPGQPLTNSDHSSAGTSAASPGQRLLQLFDAGHPDNRRGNAGVGQAEVQRRGGKVYSVSRADLGHQPARVQQGFARRSIAVHRRTTAEEAAAIGCGVEDADVQFLGQIEQRLSRTIDQREPVVRDESFEVAGSQVVLHHPNRATRDSEVPDHPLIAQLEQCADRPVRGHRVVKRDPFRVVQVDQLQVGQLPSAAGCPGPMREPGRRRSRRCRATDRPW